MLDKRRRADNAKRRESIDQGLTALEVATNTVTIWVCQGPPSCALSGDAAVMAQRAGCVWCTRILVDDDNGERTIEPWACVRLSCKGILCDVETFSERSGCLRNHDRLARDGSKVYA